VPCGYVLDPPGDYMKHMIYVVTDAGTSGTQAANEAIEYIRQRLGSLTPTRCNNTQTPDLTEEEICITFSIFGRDHGDCDTSPPLRSWKDSPLRFFVDPIDLSAPNDRLDYYTASGGVIPNCPHGQFLFPVVNQFPPSSNINIPRLYSDRSYRHPFLLNAGPTGPLKLWMEEFRATYRAAQQTLGTSVLPNPTQVYLDVEPTIMELGSMDEFYSTPRESANSVHILKQIYASRSGANFNRPNRWNDPSVPVPGDPGDVQHPNGLCLRDAYMRDKDFFGLPVLDGEPNLNNLIAVDGGVLVPGSHPGNRRICLWFAEVCERAEEAVLKNCVYDVVRHPTLGWPNAKVGNYGKSKLDGSLKYVGPMQDSVVRRGDTILPGPNNDDCDTLDCGTLSQCYHNDYYAHRGNYYGQVPQPLQCSPKVEWMPSGFSLSSNDAGLYWHINPNLDGNNDWISQRRWPYVNQAGLAPSILPSSIRSSFTRPKPRTSDFASATSSRGSARLQA
jgi:hypothetical protein